MRLVMFSYLHPFQIGKEHKILYQLNKILADLPLIIYMMYLAYGH